MTLDKTSNIIIIVLLITMLWGAYYMVTGIFEQNIKQRNSTIKQTEGSLNRLEQSLDSLGHSITTTPIRQSTKTPAETDTNIISNERQGINQTDINKAPLQKELSLLYSRLEDTEKNQAKLIETMEKRIFDIQTTAAALEAQLKKSEANEQSLREANAKLDAQLIDTAKQLQLSQGELQDLKDTKTSVNSKELLMLKGELSIQQKKLDKANALYAALKEELKTFASIISGKDALIAQKNKEIAELKGQLAVVAERFQTLEASLSQSQVTQAALVKKLNQIKELNATTQSYITQADSYIAQQDVRPNIEQISEITSVVTDKNIESNDNESKARADELRKKVEVILQPNP